MFGKKKKIQRFGGTYVEALHALLDGKENDAINLFRREIDEMPENFDAYLRLGTLLRKKGMVDKAIRIHLEQTVRPRLSRDDRRRLLWELAQDYMSAGKFKEAEDSIRNILRIEKNDSDAYRLLFDLYESSERWEDAFSALETLAGKGEVEQERLAMYRAFMGKC